MAYTLIFNCKTVGMRAPPAELLSGRKRQNMTALWHHLWPTYQSLKSCSTQNIIFVLGELHLCSESFSKFGDDIYNTQRVGILRKRGRVTFRPPTGTDKTCVHKKITHLRCTSLLRITIQFFCQPEPWRTFKNLLPYEFSQAYQFHHIGMHFLQTNLIPIKAYLLLVATKSSHNEPFPMQTSWFDTNLPH